MATEKLADMSAPELERPDDAWLMSLRGAVEYARAYRQRSVAVEVAYLAGAIAEIDRLRTGDAARVPGWMRIEEAPRDGTPVIVACQFGVRVAWYDDGELEFEELDDVWWSDIGPVAPTHWMPLPLPTTEGE